VTKNAFLMKSLTLLFLGSLLQACATIDNFTKPTATVTQGQGSQDINSAILEPYDGPKARIAVARFENKAGAGHGYRGWYNPQIGNGMADMLATALVNSNRFIVLERQNVGDVLKEQDFGASGRVKKETRAEIGEIEGAEILVTAAVTEFQGNASGAGGGVGGGGGGIFGAIGGGFRKAHMAIDLRLVDAKTSRILAATSVEGSANDINLGGILGGWFGGGAGAAALSGWKNTPKEKALRAVIIEAVKFIATKTPKQFYRHKVAR